MIEVQGLEKKFGIKPVLRGLNFNLEGGEFAALLGPNGSGKTTLIRILASLSKPSSGKIKIAQYFLPGQTALVQREIGLVSHQPLLYRELTAEENLHFFSRMYDVQDPADRIHEVLELVNLEDRKSDLVRTFSRGMMQRLSIARAILHQPQVLLLDEPFTGLDQSSGELLEQTLKSLSNAGRTILMTSHNLPRAASLASRLDILSRGRITASQKVEGVDTSQLLQFYRDALQAEGGQR